MTHFKVGDKVKLDPNKHYTRIDSNRALKENWVGTVIGIDPTENYPRVEWPNGKSIEYTKELLLPAPVSLRDKVVQEFKDKRAAALRSITTNQKTIDELYAQVELRTAEVQEYDNLLLSLGAE